MIDINELTNLYKEGVCEQWLCTGLSLNSSVIAAETLLFQQL